MVNLMNFSKLCLAYLAGVILVSCGQQPSGPEGESPQTQEALKVFTVNGVVKATEDEGKSLVVEHEAIPEFMPAMTMPFNVQNPAELRGLEPGNLITFRLLVAKDRSWIDQIRKRETVTENVPPDRPSVRVVREVEPLAVGDLLPNYSFTNELGRVVSFDDYRGKALALTFIFTRCPIPEFCPLMSKQFKAVQTQLASAPGAPDNWHLFSVSFDPHYDTPPILKGYAKMNGYDPERWSFVTGAMIDIDAITEQFGLPVVQQAGSLSHKLRTVVVDAQGRIQNIFIGNQWKSEELAEALTRAARKVPDKEAAAWRGVHVMIGSDQAANELIEELPALEALGVNALVMEINYGFAFDSHPELRNRSFLGKEQARRLAQACRERGIRPIPLFNCLGHQSWSKNTAPLLTKYPEFDETPGQFPENQGIYCRSWCPQNPEVNKIVFALLDELIEAFEADAVHVGMDEVFLIASPHCLRCRNGNPAELFAKAVNDLHKHLVGGRKVEMLLWADRLLDAAATGYGKWEAAANGTHPAVDLIPKDVILCDWHYEELSKYPGKPADYVSVPFFLDKGFRVWPSGWKNVDATEALLGSARKYKNERMLGHLCTTWGAVKIGELAEWPPIRAAMKE